MSRFDVWCVTRGCVTRWVGDGDTGRDDNHPWHRQDRGESSVPVPCPPWLHWCEEQWLHVTRLHHNHQFYCLVSWNRKSVHSLAPWVGLFSNASNAFNFSSNGRHCCCLLLSYCNYQLFSCNAPCSFALKSLVQALSQLKIPHFRCWARTGLKPEHNCTLCVQIKYLENLLSQYLKESISGLIMLICLMRDGWSSQCEGMFPSSAIPLFVVFVTVH